jgi:membrane-bound lytic murein transglycosylase A
MSQPPTSKGPVCEPPIEGELPSGMSGCELQPVAFADLAGFADDDHRAAFAVFAQHAAAIVAHQPPLRLAVPASNALRAVCRRALGRAPASAADARSFFEENFQPCRVLPESGRGFVTGYYEPVVAGSLTRTAEFTAPLLGAPKQPPAPYPTRAEIEAGALGALAAPLVFLRDRVEVFFAQVQGSLRVALTDGRQLRLTYAGRNGHPYTSIGKALVAAGELPAERVDMDQVKAWIREKGQAPDQPGGALMLRNRSYVFFSCNAALGPDDGPFGGAGLPLTTLRSVAVDRSVWNYGLPFFLSGDLPWRSDTVTSFRRLMIAGDTGSAIVGPARADIFFGSGTGAGARAGVIRHGCDVTVLLPRLLPSEGSPP